MAEDSRESIRLFAEADAAKQRARVSPSPENLKRAEEAETARRQHSLRMRQDSSKKDKRPSRRD